MRIFSSERRVRFWEPGYGGFRLKAPILFIGIQRWRNSILWSKASGAFVSWTRHSQFQSMAECLSGRNSCARYSTTQKPRSSGLLSAPRRKSWRPAKPSTKNCCIQWIQHSCLQSWMALPGHRRPDGRKWCQVMDSNHRRRKPISQASFTPAPITRPNCRRVWRERFRSPEGHDSGAATLHAFAARLQSRMTDHRPFGMHPVADDVVHQLPVVTRRTWLLEIRIYPEAISLIHVMLLARATE